MTERRLVDSAVGLAGRLSYIPYATEKVEDCGWHSSRNFARKAPVFTALGPCETWIPAEPDRVAQALPSSGALWDQSRKQQRWLLKNYPEASLGNQVLHDHFVEENSSISSKQESSRRTCFFSLGELADTTLQRTTGSPLVVTITGNTSNILRLTRLDQAQWAWNDEPNVAVRLSEVAAEKPASWIGDNLGPIRRVKCIVDRKRYNPTRWVAVQRDAGTTILQPENRKVPADGNLENKASAIAANPLFHLSREQTGGSTPSDISFNPGTRSNPPQLAIIDERGFWSIWDVGHIRFKSSGGPTPNLRIRGHVDRGVLERFPRRVISSTRWHKILWAGRPDDSLDLLGSLDLDADNEEAGSQGGFPLLQRSSSVLVCNSQRVRLFDLVSGVYLPELVFCRHGSLDSILDIEISHDPQYFYVLTTSKFFIVRVYSRPGEEWGRPEKVSSILYSTPHFRSPFDQSLRLAVTQGVKSNQATSFIFIYSSTNSWIDLLLVEFSPTDPNRVRCQANVPGLRNLQSTVLNSPIQTLCVIPTPIVVKNPGSLTKMGHDLADKHARLGQIVALRSDMSVISALCVVVSSSSIRISIPDKKVARRSRSKQVARSLRCLPSNFIAEDDLSTPETHAPNFTHKFVKAFYQHLSGIYESLDKDQLAGPAKRGRSAYNPFDAAHNSIEKALLKGPMPAHTLLQIMPNFQEVSKHSLPAMEWDSEIERLNNVNPSVAVRTLAPSRFDQYFSISTSLQEGYSSILEIADHSLQRADSDNGRERRAVAMSEEIAYDLYLSLHGIGYRNPNSGQHQTAGEGAMLPSSQADTLPSSPLRFESPASTEMSNLEGAEAEDPSMTLLRAYTGTGKFVPTKKLELLEKWQLGAEPANYTFDLDRDGDADAGKLRKAKQLAREDRKRRRTATLLHLSQEPELPATQPAPDINFFSSQPRERSSQRQIIHSDPMHAMMSQPASGPFGRRPNKKAKKRKGGF
ncbi:RNA polymerase I-specific transcription initiation factor RRN6-like protein [Xylaria palmicola]|nr:RNA polymerase I-specific transcription initiation factor RRN6-like protein [Xylaria palmicola]